VTVNQATPTLSITGGTYTYDGQPHPASASLAPSACGTPTVTYSPVNSVPVSAGSYTASAGFAGNANCAAASAGPASITINARQITVKANNTTIYVGQTPGFTYSIISGTVVGGDSLGTAVYTVNGSTTIPTSVGIYTPLAVTGLSNPNYAITTATGTFTILIRPTQLTYTGPTAGTDLGCGTTVSATLIDTVSNTGIPNVPVTITVGNQSITVNTDASGNATGSITLTQPVPAGQTVLNVTASAVYAGQTGLYSGSSDSKSFSIGGAAVVPGSTASTLYTGSRFFWTTSSTSSTATLTLSATIRDASPCGGNITKATVTFWVSADGNTWTPVSNGQNLPVGLVNPLDYSTGTASAISQYNLGKNLSAQLYVRVTVGGEYSFTGSTFDVPVTVAVPGQARTLLAGGTLTNYGDSIAGGTGFRASGYLGTGDGVTSGAMAPGAVDFGGQVTYNNKGTNPQGQVTVTIHSYNKPDGSSDGKEHSYWVKSNSISEMTLSPDGSTASFSAKSNVYDTTGDKVGLDGGGVMQFTFTKAGGIYTVPTSTGTTTYTCSNAYGCAAVAVFRSTGGLWFSSAWGTVGSLPQTIEKTIAFGTTSISK
jgi:hypothetical protein